jgi:hypothetical protein
MAEAKTKQGTSRRVAQWQKEVLQLQARALELVVEYRKARHDKPLTEVAMELSELAEDAFSLLWSGWTAELVFASATASLKAGKPLLATSPVKAIPGMPVGLIDADVEPPQKLQRDASELRVIREADPEPEPQCVEALEEVIEEIEVEVPEPTPEVEPSLPVVITEQQWEDSPEPEPEPAPPDAEPEPAPPSDGWVNGADLAKLLNCSWPTVQKYAREGLFDAHMRRPLPGEGRGKRFDPEACRIVVENRPDKRRSDRPKPPKPLRITPDALAADPELLAQVEALLAAVKGEG